MQRYELEEYCFQIEAVKRPDGKWVKYSDYKLETKRLKDTICHLCGIKSAGIPYDDYCAECEMK